MTDSKKVPEKLLQELADFDQAYGLMDMEPLPPEEWERLGTNVTDDSPRSVPNLNMQD